MSFIGHYWYVWLVGFFLCSAYLMYNQVSRMKRMFEGDVDAKSFTQGMGGFGAAAFGSTVFAVMLAISILAQFITK